ncbi:hypothetical protein CIK05_00310 [Bdellovibrio sp. qaytius]|nr:hypothetical protein CIK05_00310 [Bdellovibrio sp. qaytius]
MSLLKIGFSLMFWLSASVSYACQNSTSADRLIYIGDSHTVGTFGQQLTKNLEKVTDSKPIKRYGVVGSAAGHWNKKDNSSIRKLKIGYYCDGDGQVNGKAPKADFPTPTQLFQGAEPMVVIALGTNDVNSKCNVSDKTEQMAAVKELISQVRPNSKCIWVGPTEQPNDGPIAKNCGQTKIKAFVDNLKQTVSSRCIYIDSREIKLNGKPILPNRSDKLHYDGDLAEHWANAVSLKIQETVSPQSIKSNYQRPAPKVNHAN